MTFSITELIERKRDGGALSGFEISRIISEYTADELPHYQMSALLMAIIFRGLDAEELDAWADAMLHSGDVLDFSHIAAPKVDKHSTGGVGDKVSIPLVPMVTACGVAIPMISGRGLGHTGGTLDKLETIPGFRTALDPPEFTRILERTGLVLAGQSETLCPADRRIYLLRDSSGTVPSIPLISSSIMSKKLAEGLDALVLDVKVGSGAFMKNIDDARVLAETMVGIGLARGVVVTALLTDMSQPLGRTVGNANEMVESIEVLHGGGPPDLVGIVYRLGEEMVLASGITGDRADARRRLEHAIASGAAFEKLAEVVEAQDGDPAVLHDPGLFPRAANEHVITADRAGSVAAVDALDIGVGALRLGAGRKSRNDIINPAVGITVEVNVGDEVSAGDALAIIAWNDDASLAAALPLIERAFSITDGPVSAPPMILGEVS